MSILNDENRDPAELTIIFVNTKKQADFIVSLIVCLKQMGSFSKGGKEGKKNNKKKEMVWYGGGCDG